MNDSERIHGYEIGNSPDSDSLSGVQETFQKLVTMEMPFGKYRGTILCDLPVSYLEWFARKGFPEGNLGMLLQSIYEIKINGLQHLLDPLKN